MKVLKEALCGAKTECSCTLFIATKLFIYLLQQKYLLHFGTQRVNAAAFPEKTPCKTRGKLIEKRKETYGARRRHLSPRATREKRSDRDDVTTNVFCDATAYIYIYI